VNLRVTPRTRAIVRHRKDLPGSIALQNLLSQAPEILSILPFQRVAGRVEAQGEDLLIPAGTANCCLDPLLGYLYPSPPRKGKICLLAHREDSFNVRAYIVVYVVLVLRNRH
jgi:hypothetical protein